MVVGRDVAVGANNHARAQASLRGLAHFGRAATAEEVAERGRVEAPECVFARGGFVRCDTRGDFHDAGRDALHDVGERGAFDPVAGDRLRLALEGDGWVGVLRGPKTDQNAGHREDASGPRGFPAGQEMRRR